MLLLLFVLLEAVEVPPKLKVGFEAVGEAFWAPPNEKFRPPDGAAVDVDVLSGALVWGLNEKVGLAPAGAAAVFVLVAPDADVAAEFVVPPKLNLGFDSVPWPVFCA